MFMNYRAINDIQRNNGNNQLYQKKNKSVSLYFSQNSTFDFNNSHLTE